MNLRHCPNCEGTVLIHTREVGETNSILHRLYHPTAVRCSLCGMQGPEAWSFVQAERLWNQLPRVTRL